MPDQLTDASPRGGGRFPDTPRADLPDQVTMPLLDRIVRGALDEDYQVVAAGRAERQRARRPKGRREAASTPAARWGRPRQVAAAVMAAFGVLVAIAALQTSRDAPAAHASRASL